MLGKKRQISGQQDKGRKMCGGREECMDEGEDESFVVLMLNELENTIELFWLWKSLWGHRKLAPVWELACWQKRGFVWHAGSLWDPQSSVRARTAVRWGVIFSSLLSHQIISLSQKCFPSFIFVLLALYMSCSFSVSFALLFYNQGQTSGQRTDRRRKGRKEKGSEDGSNSSLIFCELQRVTLHSGFAGLAHAFCY